MKMYVPEIGDTFVLTNDWTFDLYHEYRNSKLLEKIGQKFDWRTNSNKAKFVTTILKGTELKVDRIYIRKGASDYSSLTFFIGSGEWKGCRFWAKLSDVNKIEFDEAKASTAINVSFELSFPLSKKGDIMRRNDYETWFRYSYKNFKAKINGKKDVLVIINTEKENLTKDECKLLNSQKRLWEETYTVNDVRITKFELKAIYIPTGEVIGTGGTTPIISKKIKEFAKAKGL